MLVLYNDNEIQEKNQIKNIKSSLYSRKYPLMGAASVRALHSATGTQFDVAAVAGHRQLVLDLINAEIEPSLPHKIRH